MGGYYPTSHVYFSISLFFHVTYFATCPIQFFFFSFFFIGGILVIFLSVRVAGWGGCGCGCGLAGREGFIAVFDVYQC